MLSEKTSFGGLRENILGSLTIQELRDAGDLLSALVEREEPDIVVAVRPHRRVCRQRRSANSSTLAGNCDIVLDGHLLAVSFQLLLVSGVDEETHEPCRLYPVPRCA